MDIPEIEETKRQGIVVKDNETPDEQRERLGKLEAIWADGARQSKRNECAFFQGLLDKEYAEKGEKAPNLYPEVFPNGVEADLEKRRTSELSHRPTET